MVESDGRIRQQIVNDLEKLIGVTPRITSSIKHSLLTFNPELLNPEFTIHK